MTPPLSSSASLIREVPLCVDLDGTLLVTDTFRETVWLFLRQQPWNGWRFPFWLSRGRAYLKQQVASAVNFDPTVWPVHAEFLAFVRGERARGRRLILATGSDQQVARRVAEHFGLFDEVIASDGVTNVTGPRKLAKLRERFGERGFDYAGNSSVDYPVWQGANAALVVNARASVARRAHEVAKVLRVFP